MNFSDDLELSIISEIGNVSVGGAAASLSDFVNKVVTISIPTIKVVSFKELKNQFEPAVVFAKIDYKNGLDGSNILIMKKEEAQDFSKIIVKEKLGMELETWDDFARNVLTEVFNIMVGNMSSTMSETFNKKVRIDTPQLFEKLANELDFFKDNERLITVWFDVKIENLFNLRLVKIITEDQADQMINLIKGDHQL